MSAAGLREERWAACARPLSQLQLVSHTPTVQVNYLITTSVLLVRMKRKELEFKARQRRRAEIAAAGAAGAAGGSGEGGSGGAAGAAAAGEAKKER